MQIDAFLIVFKEMSAKRLKVLPNAADKFGLMSQL